MSEEKEVPVRQQSLKTTSGLPSKNDTSFVGKRMQQLGQQSEQAYAHPEPTTDSGEQLMTVKKSTVQSLFFRAKLNTIAWGVVGALLMYMFKPHILSFLKAAWEKVKGVTKTASESAQ